MRLAAVLALGACTVTNDMIQGPVAAAQIHPPHEAVIVHHDIGAERVFLDSGGRAPAAVPAETAHDGVETCAARGQRLEVKRDGGRQRIVLAAIAKSDDPDQLAAGDRVLVEASDNPHSQGQFPAAFGGLMFTRSCDYFVFEFDHRVYVGDVATGRFAFVAPGYLPERAP